MPHPLHSLPQVLLQALGRTGSQEDLHEVVSARRFAQLPLRQHHNGSPYTVTADAGLDLTLQNTNPHVAKAAEADHQWGLHSFTLHAGEWAYAWPEGLDPLTATAQDVVRLFAPDPESSLVTATMVCFTIPGLHEAQQWSVLCLFDAASQRLQSFSLVRVGDWLR